MMAGRKTERRYGAYAVLMWNVLVVPVCS